MRALVTGGAGFIGSHLVDRLIRDGWHVDVVDDLSTGCLGNLDAAKATGRCQAIQADITSPDFTERMLRRTPDVVFHLAAQIDVRASVADPSRDASVNILGTVNVLETARRAGARKVVNVSSVAIYGVCDELPVTDHTPINPLSPYAASKLAAAAYCHQYQQLHGLNTTTVVLTNVYGPRQRRGSGAVAIWAEAMLTGQPTYLYGAGNIRDYLYVTDAVDAVARAAEETTTASRVEVGTGIPVTDRQLHDAIAAAVGVHAEPVPQPRRHGDVAAMYVDSAIARRALGWQPRVPLAEGLSATVQHIRGQLVRQPI
ncbi:SDR family NAD(P)-dependent oxidoreductase [Micromonospora sp. CPCC 205371]|nr:SDR family NAD(P)-dependent oxidoreductase [Micromonospora sp. CPCC 205371]